jgi:hypothetical protein
MQSEEMFEIDGHCHTAYILLKIIHGYSVEAGTGQTE